MKKKNEKKTESSKNALLIILNFVWMFLLYQSAIYLSERMGTALIYQICTAVYAAAFVLFFGRYWVRTRTAEAMRLSIERKDIEDSELLRTAAETSQKAKRLLVWIFPIVIIFFIDLCDLFILEYFKQLFSSIR